MARSLRISNSEQLSIVQMISTEWDLIYLVGTLMELTKLLATRKWSHFSITSAPITHLV